MKYAAEFLRSKGLLVGHAVVRTRGDFEPGIHMGLYAKSFFENLEEFGNFARVVSSITQDWYGSGDLDFALESFFPDDSGQSALQGMKPISGSFSAWLASIRADVAVADLPFDFDGSLWAWGDRAEFHAIGENSDYFFEAFLADCTT